MRSDLATIAQKILDGSWRHAQAARVACQERSWAAFVERVAEPRALLIGRFARAACVDLAASMFSGPLETTYEIVPVWASSAEEEPFAEWFLAHAVRVGDEPFGLAETSPIFQDAALSLSARVTGRLRQWRVGHVVPTSAYVS